MVNKLGKGVSQYLAVTKKLWNKRRLEGLRNFKSSNGANRMDLLIFAGDIKTNTGPRNRCGFSKKYCKASKKWVECEHCVKRFHI